MPRYPGTHKMKKNFKQPASQDQRSLNSFESFWENEELTDIIFYVGEEITGIWRFAAHKLVLSKCSPEFKKMFSCYNSENSVKQDENEDINNKFNPSDQRSQPVLEIFITDIPPETFHQLLRYLYTNTLDIESVDSAILLCQVAKKFEIKMLLKSAADYLASNITVKNVLYIYNQVEDYINQDEFLPVHANCAELIDLQTENVFNTNAFLYLTPDVLQEITARNTLQLSSEMVLLDALLRWSVAECKRRHLIVNNENKRKVLENILFNVRFGLLTTKEMLQVYKGNSSMKEELTESSSSQEANDYQDSILSAEDEVMFRRDRRLNGNLSISRFQGNMKIKQHSFPKEHNIKFLSHSKFILTSVTLQGCETFRKSQIFFSFSKENEIVFENVISCPLYDFTRNIISIPFPCPVYVEPYINYEFYVHVEAGCLIYEADVTTSVCEWNDGSKDCYLQWKNCTLANGNLNGSAVGYGQLFQLKIILPLRNTEINISSLSENEQKRIYWENIRFQFLLWQNRICRFFW